MFAQRRHVNVEDIEPVIEIVAQLTGGDSVVRNFVGGGEHTHVDCGFHFASQAAQLVIFEHTQQFCLRSHGHLANFVEQDRAAFGQLEAAGAPFQRSGEGAFFVAEDLAFDQRFGNGCAVDGDERPVAARTQLMNSAGDEFLASAAGSGNQHGRGAGRNQFDEAKNLLHLARCSLELAERTGIPHLAACALQFGARSHQRGCVLQHGAQPAGVDGFRNVVVSPHPHGLYRAVDGALRGHHDDCHGL